MIYVYGAIALLVLLIGGAGEHYVFDAPAYARLNSQFSDYKAQVALMTAGQEQAYADALAKQQENLKTVVANNQQVMQELQSERDSATSDRDFARRLLNAARSAPAAKAPAGTGTGSGPAAPAVPQGGGDQSLAGLLAGAAGECRDALQLFVALQSQVIPQLPTPKVPK